MQVLQEPATRCSTEDGVALKRVGKKKSESVVPRWLCSKPNQFYVVNGSLCKSHT